MIVGKIYFFICAFKFKIESIFIILFINSFFLSFFFILVVEVALLEKDKEIEKEDMETTTETILVLNVVDLKSKKSCLK